MKSFKTHTSEGTFTSGTTESANTFDGSVSCAVDGTVNDVWYKFTIGASGVVEINTTLGTAAKLSGAIYATCGGDAIYCNSDVSKFISFLLHSFTNFEI